MSTRIDRNPRTNVGATQKQEPASTAAKSTAGNSVAERSRLNGATVDAFQGAPLTQRALASLGNPTATANQIAATPAPVLSREEEAAARKALENATNREDPSYITEWLKAHPDPAQQAAFMDMLFEYGAPAGNLLDKAGKLSPEDQKLLSKAVDAAYRSGALTLDELTEAVGSHGNGSWGGETHETLANIIAGTGNPELINAYVERELEIMTASNAEDPARAVAIATALAGLPPAELQKFLERHPDIVPLLLKNLEDPIVIGGGSALGKLLDAASAIQPPTEQSLQVFMDSISHLGENSDSRAAAARFFQRNADAILSALEDASGSIGSHGAGKLSEFFTRTLFTEPAYEGQEAFHEFVTGKLSEMQQALETQAQARSPSEETQRLARTMGSLVGAIEGGFLLAVEELDKRNEAVEGLVGLLFKLKGLLPSSKLPGAGKLQDLTIDQIEKWVVNALKEHADDPKDAIPFHRLFGEQISNPILRSLYDAARLTSLENRELGLND
ncbi:hypothetical protein HUW62_01720 [Myxococcus sp. AM011]|uniref:hypothetical protein n=1 Tax=Myxococcus sp. AM011 TaxID=2745200 RepID=UPI001595271C|nr:hypothetical protein [Myxococcus sp. AM011]NVJ19956.1 hypothetical protein [Myxococcus sp. AM011]